MSAVSSPTAHRAIVRTELLGLPSHLALFFALLFAGSIVFYAVLWPMAPLSAPDTAGYLAAARDLADLKLDQLQPRTPGYPLLLNLTGSTDKPTRFLYLSQLLLHFLSTWLLASTLVHLSCPKWLVITFGVLMALPVYTEPAAYAMTESLAEFTLAVSFATIVSWKLDGHARSLIVAALFLASAALTRPVYQFLPLAIASSIVFLHKFVSNNDFQGIGVYKACFIIILLPSLIVGALVLHNFATFRYFGLTPQTGFHLATRTALFIERLPQQYGAVREVLIRSRNESLVSGESVSAQ